MPKASWETASEKVMTNGLEVRLEHLNGGYSPWRLLGLLRIAYCHRQSRRSISWSARRPAPALGLRDQREGRPPLRRPRGDLRGGRRLLRAARPHPRPLRRAELVEFSPTEVLGQTIPVVLGNLQAIGAEVEAGR